MKYVTIFYCIIYIEFQLNRLPPHGCNLWLPANCKDQSAKAFGIQKLTQTSTCKTKHTTNLHFGKRMLTNVLVGTDAQAAGNVDRSIVQIGTTAIVQIVRTVVRVVIS